MTKIINITLAILTISAIWLVGTPCLASTKTQSGTVTLNFYLQNELTNTYGKDRNYPSVAPVINNFFNDCPSGGTSGSCNTIRTSKEVKPKTGQQQIVSGLILSTSSSLKEHYFSLNLGDNSYLHYKCTYDAPLGGSGSPLILLVTLTGDRSSIASMSNLKETINVVTSGGVPVAAYTGSCSQIATIDPNHPLGLQATNKQATKSKKA